MPKFNYLSALLLKRCVESGISDPTELANIMGNSAVETANFTTMHEYFGYTSADNLIKKVPSADNRFTRAEVEDAVNSRDPIRIATVMYDKRDRGIGGLGNTEPGDGWKYHGRGYFQYTGRANYTEYGKLFNVDLVNNPDQAADPEISAKLAIAYWHHKVPESSRKDARAAGLAINGGGHSAPEREKAAAAWSETVTPELIADVASGKMTLDQLSFHGWDALKDGVLKRGERAMEIRELQNNLNKLGVKDAKGNVLEPNGTFNTSTMQAVASFQKLAGLPVEKVVKVGTIEIVESYAQTVGVLRTPFDTTHGTTSNNPFDLLNQAQKALGLTDPQDFMQPDAHGVPDYMRSRVNFAPGQTSDTVRKTSAPSQAPQAPQAPQPPAADGTLQVGSRGEPVKSLQRDLHTLGYTDAAGNPLQADGVYGNGTRAAVMQFQQDRGLAATGVADNKTVHAVQAFASVRALAQQAEALAKAPPANAQAASPENIPPGPPSQNPLSSTPPADMRAASPEPAPEKPLRLGDAGPDVAAMQQSLLQLGINRHLKTPIQADGIFGSDTQRAVQAFQLWHGSEQINGIADAATREAIVQQARLAIDQRAQDISQGNLPRDFVDNASLGGTQNPLDAADLRNPRQGDVSPFRPQESAQQQPASPAQKPTHPQEAPAQDATPAQEPLSSLPALGPAHPYHARYEELRQHLPFASEERLAQFAAACHTAGLEPLQPLTTVKAAEDGSSLLLGAAWPPGAWVKVDMNTPVPATQQSLQTVAAFDHQQAVQLAQFEQQRQQANAQAQQV